MKNILVLIENNLRISILKKPIQFVLYTLFPVFIILIFSQMLGYSQGYINVGIVDNDNTKTSKVMVNNIEKTDSINIINIKENDIKDKIIQKDIDFSITIPQNFEKNLVDNKNPQVNIKSPANNNLHSVVKNSLNLEIQNMKDLASISNKDKNKYHSLLDKYLSSEVRVKKASLNDLKSGYENCRLFVSFLIMFMFFKASSGAYIINLDKDNNIYTRIFTTPIKTYEYYLANVISNIICLLIQIIIAVLGLKYIIDIEIGMKYTHLFIILATIAIVAVSLGNLCIAMTKEKSEASMVINIITMIFLVVGGCLAPIEVLPDFMRKLSYFTPTRWALMSISDLQQGISFLVVSKYLFIMILFSITFFVITAYKTSRSEKEFKISG